MSRDVYQVCFWGGTHAHDRSSNSKSDGRWEACCQYNDQYSHGKRPPIRHVYVSYKPNGDCFDGGSPWGANTRPLYSRNGRSLDSHQPHHFGRGDAGSDPAVYAYVYVGRGD